MNRIFFGRTSKVEISDGEEWRPLEAWEGALWQFHCLYQTTVNYYTLCFAEMARGIDDPTFETTAFAVAQEAAARDPKHKTETARQKAVDAAAETARGMITALRAWRGAVIAKWTAGERRGKTFDGGYQTVAPILGVPVHRGIAPEDAFRSCAAVALAGSKASVAGRAAAFLQLLEEADGSDLSQLVNDRLGWFCSPQGKNDKTPKSVASMQEKKRQQLVREFRDLPDGEAVARAKDIDLGLFVTTPPEGENVGGAAASLLREYWKKVVALYPAVANASAILDAVAPIPQKAVSLHGAPEKPALRLPALGRKPSGIYPVAAVFRFVPCAETLAAFRAATASLSAAKDKPELDDLIADSRVEDTPHFDYFTNLAFHRDGEAKQQAVWKEFDNAALIEAVKSPHRYYQDTQKREAAANALREDLQAMEGEGREGSADEGMAAKTELNGFRDDTRIDRLLEILYSDLGHLGEVDSPDDDWLERPFITEAIKRLRIQLPEHAREYTLRERTLRSWPAIRDEWRDAGKGKLSEEELWAFVAKEQSEHRMDFGSARFYKELTKPANHAIWKDKGPRDFHADDPVSAWADYTELRRDLRDKERPIRFTPAHPTESPRFFIFPKKAAAGGKWGSAHKLAPAAEARVPGGGALSFTAGIAVRDGAKWKTVMTRISYSAPRLRRDQMRRDGEESLEAAPWLPPMIDALQLPEPPLQDFGNCRIILQPRAHEDEGGEMRYSVQLTFPVEIQPEKLIEQIGKAKVWEKRFNLTPDGEKFRESTFRRKFEKQPTNPPPRLEDLIQRFTFGSVDFGLHADAWAMHEVRLDNQFGTDKKGRSVASRAISVGDEAPWRLATRELRKLRLPGSDVFVWRKRSKKDHDDKPEFARRQELYGDRGRYASPDETGEARFLMCDLLGREAAWEFATRQRVTVQTPLPPDWMAQINTVFAKFSFPEQNDKLIVVARRAQSRLARIGRWRVGLSDAARRSGVLVELRSICGIVDKESETGEAAPTAVVELEKWIPENVRIAVKADALNEIAKAAANDRDVVVNVAAEVALADLAAALRAEHASRIEALRSPLEQIADRVLPLRRHRWKWDRVEDREKEGRLNGLKQVEDKTHKPLLAGQRGLSLKRIEQVEELRRRFQSLNQAERRHFAAEEGEAGRSIVCRGRLMSPREWVRDEFTDPCEGLLDKLQELKTQRVNQSAHLILAQALGVRLAEPPTNKKELKRERDQHGVYEKFREPVDFIAIEDLSRYRTTQGRSPQENGRLMKWCHRAVRDKLRELCEPFGIPVLEVPAAYSSQFCARSGVIGFRAEEVTRGFEELAPWCFRLKVKEGEVETTEQTQMRELAVALAKAQDALDREWATKKSLKPPPKVTLIMPKQGGQIFVPIVSLPSRGNRLAGAVGDADLNAAVNVGLRAVADPRMWEFFPRLRTERISGEVRYKGRKGKKQKVADPDAPQIALRAREKRKYGPQGPALSLGELPSGSAALETKQPNYFRDFAAIAEWDKAWVDDPALPSARTELFSAKALFVALKRQQWERCYQINRARLAARGF